MRTITWVRGLVAVLVGVLGAPLACSSDESGARGGSCETSADCDDGVRCVGTRTDATCLPLESAPCSEDGDCPSGLVCAPDLQCRSSCQDALGCPRGQTCARSGQCAEPGEVDSNGVLVDAVPGAGGASGAGGRTGTGGRQGTGGRTAAGGAVSSGGSIGATGGRVGSGGRPGAGGAVVGPRCDPGLASNECQACVEAKCCEEYYACADPVCAGTGATAGELECFQSCIASASEDPGFIDQDTVLGCAGSCAAEGGALAPSTERVITCILNGDSPVDGGLRGCSIECYGVDLSSF